MNEAKKPLFTVREMALIGIMAAIICIAAPFSIPTPTGIPLSLATFAVYLSGLMLGRRDGTLAVVLYVLIGMIGLPVFSGFSGGIAKLFGVTGGYILGYIPCALICGVFSDLFTEKSRFWAYPVGIILGTLVCYAFGTAWFVIFTKSELLSAIALCVLPYLPGDAVKTVAACAIAMPLKSRLRRLFERKKKSV